MADNEQLVLSISADTRAMQRQLDKLVKSLGDVDNSAAQAFTKAPPKIDAVTKSLGAAKFQTANVAAQFQDIAVQLQGGQSPFTVALQQGTQLTQQLGQAGAGGAVKLLGSAFASLLSPISLATVGIIALGGYAVQYGVKAIGATRNVDDILKDHSEHIKALKESYGEAGKGVDIYVRKTTQIAKAQVNQSIDETEKKFKSLSAAALDSLSSTRTVVTGYGNTLANAGQATDTRFAAFKTQIDALRESAKSGLPDFRTFATQISEIRNTTADAKIKKLADEVLNLIGQLPDMNDKLLSSGKALRNFGSAALEAAAQGEEFAKAMKALGGTVSPDLSEREKIMKNYAAALEKAQGSEERAAASRVRDNQLSILSANELKKSIEEQSKAAESAAKRFQGQLESVQKRNAQLFGGTPAIGRGVRALEMMGA